MKPSRIISLKFLLSLILLSLTLTSANAQSGFSIGIRFMGLAFHPKKSPHPQLYKSRIDRNGHWVITTGLAVAVNYHLNNEVSLRFSQALLTNDCANKNAGMTQLGLNISYPFDNNKQELSACFGPMFFYRKSWNNLPGYIDEGLFKLSPGGKNQYKFVWYGIYGDYSIALNTRNAVSFSVLPGIPELIAIAPGMTYRIKPQGGFE